MAAVGQQPWAPQGQQPAYPQGQLPVYPQVNQPAYPQAQQPVYPQAQQGAFPQAQQPVYPQVQQPVFPQAQQPVYPQVQQPVYPQAQQPIYPQAQQPQTSAPQQPQSPVILQPVNLQAQQPQRSEADIIADYTRRQEDARRALDLAFVERDRVKQERADEIAAAIAAHDAARAAKAVADAADAAAKATADEAAYRARVEKHFKKLGFTDAEIPGLIQRETWQGLTIAPPPLDPQQGALVPAGNPNGTKIKWLYIEEETLNTHHVPWHRDPLLPEYAMIDVYLTVDETNILFNHTKRLRRARLPIAPAPGAGGGNKGNGGLAVVRRGGNKPVAPVDVNAFRQRMAWRLAAAALT